MVPCYRMRNKLKLLHMKDVQIYMLELTFFLPNSTLPHVDVTCLIPSQKLNGPQP